MNLFFESDPEVQDRLEEFRKVFSPHYLTTEQEKFIVGPYGVPATGLSVEQSLRLIAVLMKLK